MQEISKSKLGISRMLIVIVVVVIVVVGAAGGLYLTSLTSSSSTTKSTTSSTTSSTSATGVTSTGSSTTCKPTASNPPSEITIGASVPLSGDFSGYSVTLLDGALAAQQYINQVRGGIYVKAYCESIPLKLEYYDDQSTPSVAVGIYNKLIAQNVTALWGSYGTPIAYAYAPEVQQSGIPMVVTNAFGNNIWLQNFSNIFCTCPIASLAGTLGVKSFWDAVTSLNGPHVTNASFIADQNENVIAQVDSTIAYLTSLGIKNVYNTTIPDGLTSYASQVASIKAANPGLLYIFIEDTPSLTTFDKELAVAGVHPSILYGAASNQPGILQSVGSAALGSLSSGGWTPANAPVNQSDVARQLSFYLNYSSSHGWTTAVTENGDYGWGAMIVLSDAIQAAGSLNHAAIVKALTGPYYSIYGPYTPGSPTHTVNYLPSSITQVQMVNGSLQFVLIWPKGQGTVPPVWNSGG